MPARPISASDILPLIAGLPPYQAQPAGASQFNLPCSSLTSLTVPSGAQQCVVSIEGGSVRYSHDGQTNPSATVGHLLPAGTFEPFVGATILANLKFFPASGSPIINASYLK